MITCLLIREHQSGRRHYPSYYRTLLAAPLVLYVRKSLARVARKERLERRMQIVSVRWGNALICVRSHVDNVPSNWSLK